MIQRIQTLYLFATAALMVTALLTPLAYFAAGTDEYTLRAFSLSGGEMSQSTIYMGIVMALAAAVPLVNIFLFKRRMLQIILLPQYTHGFAGGVPHAGLPHSGRLSSGGAGVGLSGHARHLQG